MIQYDEVLYLNHVYYPLYQKIETCLLYVIFGAEFRYESNGQDS